ncbi:MAG TPA: 2-oxoacid:acceptor oxidoreductase subunit alpha [Sedimentisphaerales bacterium]|nr:2-oxoacid:acceptor oxidoreductase subunit alpha [Phycisphaerae bacterium]HON92276.1 2-oxoacid:acceptor oxidoreductase subunit alpha [Sedimentisphaerales bacterium]HOV76672.1 2-oxoacid:acceptor oxidoreductase subunit alpha [Sedimentisphaerales bacterium]
MHRDDLSIVLCGQAGQGVQTVEFLLTRLLKLAGYHVFATKEYMSRVRGGLNSTTIRVSNHEVAAYVHRMDILVPLSGGAVEHVAKRISPGTVVLGEQKVIGDGPVLASCRVLEVPFTKIAQEIGNALYSNSVAVGAVAGALGLDLQPVTDYVRRFFAGKQASVGEDNVRAAQAGYKAVESLDVDELAIDPATDTGGTDRLLLDGAEAVGLGALAGGCNFVSSYPMSPSTPVLTFMARHGDEFGVVVEQAEDEIAAINMAIGAGYAGARALVTTSGGGFALMTEGVSLAGMLETPIVIHLAQRPGPATGLPTRTEQGDLELALYAGHGEFPRIILAPGSLDDGFHLAQQAFNLADKYQVPVFILTDQYYIDSYYDAPPFDLSKAAVEKHVVKTAKDYRRYVITQDGVSARGVPGFGEGLVVVDSDEHDEEGHITEDLDLRVRMVNKRLAKGASLTMDVVSPVLVGPENYKNLVICWGSTYHVVKEAIAQLGRNDTAMLHYRQVYPLHDRTGEYMARAERTIVVEGNATGQFAKLIELYTGVPADELMLKYNGMNFSVEEVVDGLKALIKEVA